MDRVDSLVEDAVDLVSSSSTKGREVLRKSLAQQWLSIPSSAPSTEHEEASLSSSLVRNYEKVEIERERKRFTDGLISLLLSEEFEYGIDTKADAFVGEYIKLNAPLVKEWLQTIFLRNNSNSSILVGLLRVIARIDYSEIYPQGQIMAIAAFSHKNIEVQECGVRAFENWDYAEEESIKTLENHKVSVKWLQEYINRVVLYLREQRSASTH